MKSEEIFEVLAREHAEMLSIYLQTLLPDANDVDDVFQETYLVAWRNLDRFDKSRSFGAWVRGIARKLVLAHRSQRGRAPLVCTPDVLEVIDARCEALQKQAGDTLEEKLLVLRDCIERLPPKYRNAIDVRYRQELRGQGLAAMLETSIENTKKLLQRGRDLLAQCFQRNMSLEEISHDRTGSSRA